MIKDERNNVVQDSDSGIKVKIYPSARDCIVKVGQNCRLENFQVHLYAENLIVEIGSNNNIRGDAYMKISNARLEIGNFNNIRNNVFMNIGGDITIGDNCLFAAVKFRSTDSHKIYDEASGQQVNADSPIFVGNKVWLAEDVLLLGGARVGNGCVVGARSLIVSQLPDKCLAVGLPAKVVRAGIRWEE